MLIARLGAGMRAFFHRFTGARDGKNAGSVESGSAGNGRALDSPEFASCLRKVFRDHETVAAGGIHVIGLDRARAKFGKKWPKIAGRVGSIVSQAIERRLGPGDLFATYGDTTYVILFPQLSGDAARLKCTLIAQEIARRLFGDGGNPDLVDVAMTMIDSKGALQIESLGAKAVLADVVDRRRHGADWHEVGQAPGSPPPEWQQEVGAGRPQEVPSMRSDEAPRGGAVGAPPRAARFLDLGPLQFVYRPMWLIRRGLCSAHSCIPARVTSEGTALTGGAALMSSPGSMVNAEYDATCLRAVASEFLRMEKSGRKAVLLAPVHFVTIADSRLRTEFMAAVSEIPDRFRKSLLFELIAIPPGTPQSRYPEVMGVLAGIGCPVLVRLRLDHSRFDMLQGLGIYAVGADVSNLDLPEIELAAGFDKFVASAEQHGFNAYIHGLSTTSLTAAAVGAGFHCVDGDPVMSILDEPAETTEFGIGKLYQPLIQALSDI